MIDLEKEAEEEYPLEGQDSIFCDLGLIQQKAFIEGAKSRHVQAKILQAQIDVLEKLIYPDKVMLKMDLKVQSAAVISNMRVKELQKELQQKLKELENEHTTELS